MSESNSPLARNIFEVFNERDGQKRLSLMKALYREDAVFHESNDASFVGLEVINNRVTEVLGTIAPDLLFRPAAAEESNHDVSRVAWTLSKSGGPVVLSGMDIGVLRDGKIATLYMFVDPPVAK